MSVQEARAVLKSAKFLQSCVAGRHVFAKRKCASVLKEDMTEEQAREADASHMAAINRFTRALIALNNKRHAAIGVVVNEAEKPNCPKSKSRGSNTKKEKGGSKKQKHKKPTQGVTNVFSLLMDEVEEALDNLQIGDGESKHDTNNTGSTDGGHHMEESEAGHDTENEMEIIEAFLATEVMLVKDTVLQILQSDYLEEISTNIWGSVTK